MAQDVTVITGASSGIGAALARRVARDGRHVVLVARRADRLDALATEIQAEHGVGAHAVAADLARPDAVGALAAQIEGRGLVVDWLINNAGVGTHGCFHELPIDKEIEQIQLNVGALVALTGHFLPGMIRRGRGAVVNVASVAAFAAGPYMATYCATKAFIKSFSEAIAAETVSKGVHVLCVCPGFTRTEFQSKADVDVSYLPGFVWMSADEVADQTVRAVGRKAVMVNGVLNGATATLMRLAPWGAIRVLGAVMRPQQK